MIRIPAGAFLRGSPPSIGLPDEHPQREIFLSEFEIDKLPVTFGDFRAFVDAGGYSESSFWSEEGWVQVQLHHWERPRFFGEPEWSHVAQDDQPAVGVSFYEAEAFARFSGK